MKTVTIPKYIIDRAITGIGWKSVLEWNEALRKYVVVSCHRSEDLAMKQIEFMEKC